MKTFAFNLLQSRPVVFIEMLYVFETKLLLNKTVAFSITVIGTTYIYIYFVSTYARPSVRSD